MRFWKSRKQREEGNLTHLNRGMLAHFLCEMPEERDNLLEKAKADGLLEENLAAYMMQCGDGQLMAGNDANAVKHFETATTIWRMLGSPISPLTLHLSDRWERAQGLEEAECIYRALPERTPPFTFIVPMSLGWLSMMREDANAALTLFTEAIQAVPRGDADAHAIVAVQLGLAAYLTGNKGAAADSFSAIRRDATSEERFKVAMYVAQLLNESTTVATDTMVAKGFLDVAEAFFCARCWKQAVFCYGKAITRDPNNVEAHRCLGDAYFQQGLTRKALSCYIQAVAICPQDSRSFNYMGHARLRLREIDEAIRCVKTALDIDPDYVEAAANLRAIQRIQALPPEDIEEAIDAV